MKRLPKRQSADNSDTPDLYILEEQATTAIEQLAKIILSDQLIDDITKGSAAWSLHRLTYLAVDTLGIIAHRKPSQLREIAETSIAWPAFISWHGDFTKTNLELMERLGLSEKHVLRFTFPKSRRGKRWSHKTPVNRYALNMIRGLFARQCNCRSIERERRDKRMREIRKRHGFEEPKITFQSEKLTKQILALKPLGPKTVEQWLDAGWNMLLEETKGHPEKNAELRKLGAYRKSKTIAANQTADLGGKTSESNIRDGIKQRLGKAFKELISDKP